MVQRAGTAWSTPNGLSPAGNDAAARSVRSRTEPPRGGGQNGGMDMTLWALTGAAIGWLTFSLFGMNAARGFLVALAIGAGGGLIGGAAVAPLFIGAPGVAASSGDALLFAGGAALALLTAASILHSRWNV